MNTTQIINAINALGCRKQEISKIFDSLIAKNLDKIIKELEQGSLNGTWDRILSIALEENKKKYSMPAQYGVLDAANNYAKGLLEKVQERTYLNYTNPDFVTFIRRRKRLPELDELS